MAALRLAPCLQPCELLTSGNSCWLDCHQSRQNPGRYDLTQLVEFLVPKFNLAHPRFLFQRAWPRAAWRATAYLVFTLADEPSLFHILAGQPQRSVSGVDRNPPRRIHRSEDGPCLASDGKDPQLEQRRKRRRLPVPVFLSSEDQRGLAATLSACQKGPFSGHLERMDFRRLPIIRRYVRALNARRAKHGRGLCRE